MFLRSHGSVNPSENCSCNGVRANDRILGADNSWQVDAEAHGPEFYVVMRRDVVSSQNLDSGIVHVVTTHERGCERRIRGHRCVVVAEPRLRAVSADLCEQAPNVSAVAGGLQPIDDPLDK